MNTAELRIDSYRTGAPDAVESVRITHTPTGLGVTCGSEATGEENRAKALEKIKALLNATRRSEG